MTAFLGMTGMPVFYGESPEHAQATRKCIAEQQGCLS